ncbi:hypothetical protein [Streptomyces kebangsaanensis]|uniref:DUF3040 domain-containing protein n=1 Tax=Streptomyces kebangsaanensis TaxID=864058 RepID=A0ABW6KQ54_9ACTN|nr:hypothetical protein [Streptomyces kebangsaanensis]
MTEGDWYDDSDYDEALRRADRATRLGWKVIAGVTGLLGLGLIAAAVGSVAVVVAAVYVLMVSDY